METQAHLVTLGAKGEKAKWRTGINAGDRVPNQHLVFFPNPPAPGNNF
jgi:hypothetical protein